jgi:hypothetical protein
VFDNEGKTLQKHFVVDLYSSRQVSGDMSGGLYEGGMTGKPATTGNFKDITVLSHACKPNPRDVSGSSVK